MGVNSVVFKCRVVTPMFMAGADNETPELRPSEFKGMMRFWWRAIKAEDNIEKLKQEEAQIFGGTGEGQGKSKVWIRVKQLNMKLKEAYPLPHKRNFKKLCFSPDSEFEIELSIFEKKYEKIIKALFILTTILGGFGKRARRGFGSVEIKGLKIDLNTLTALLNKIESFYQLQNGRIVNSKKGGQYPWIKTIEIGKTYKDVDELLMKIGEASHKYKDPSLGNATPRMASPVYVSIIKDEEFYRPIITTLNFSPKKGYPKWDLKNQELFKKEILL
jgi:CRISPR-associated protein Cmr1